MPSQYESAVPGLNALLRDLRQLGKDAQGDLRTASQNIADRHMVPAWQDAARQHAGPWGGRIAESVRSRRDRIPVVVIGKRSRTMSGGASSIMVRSPSNLGPASRGARQTGWPAAFNTRRDWMTLAYKGYIRGAVQEWLNAVGDIVSRWNDTGRRSY